MDADSGKKSDMKDEWLLVVAGALSRGDGRWLMHRRPAGKHHAGLWEFPGGKVELSEFPVKALLRELREEIGIEADEAACRPAGFAETGHSDSERGIVILLYSLDRWRGEPQALEGGRIGWFTPDEVRALSKPPLDEVLAETLLGTG